MGGGGYHSVPTKDDLKKEARKHPYLLWPALAMCVTIGGVFVVLFAGFVVFTFTENVHYLALCVNLVGKGFATALGIFTYLLVAGLVTLWREW